MSLFGGILDSIGGFLGHQAEKKQAKKSAQDYIGARDNSVNAFAGARDASVAGYQPFLQGGQQGFQNALNMQTPGFQYSPSDPSYAWRLGQGVEALDRSAAANGSLNSGGQLKALTRYGQGLASTEFQNDFARNNTLGGYGIQAAQGDAQAQTNFANGNALAQFRGADGLSGARTAKGNATASQWGDVANGIESVGRFFGF
jgi:hypothetical protein